MVVAVVEIEKSQKAGEENSDFLLAVEVTAEEVMMTAEEVMMTAEEVMMTEEGMMAEEMTVARVVRKMTAEEMNHRRLVAVVEGIVMSLVEIVWENPHRNLKPLIKAISKMK